MDDFLPKLVFQKFGVIGTAESTRLQNFFLFVEELKEFGSELVSTTIFHNASSGEVARSEV